MEGNGRAGRLGAFGGLCSLCHREPGTEGIYDNNGLNIKEKIEFVFPWNLQNYPQLRYVCRSCVRNLNNAFEMKMGVLNGQPERIRALPVPYPNPLDYAFQQFPPAGAHSADNPPDNPPDQ